MMVGILIIRAEISSYLFAPVCTNDCSTLCVFTMKLTQTELLFLVLYLLWPNCCELHTYRLEWDIQIRLLIKSVSKSVTPLGLQVTCWQNDWTHPDGNIPFRSQFWPVLCPTYTHTTTGLNPYTWCHRNTIWFRSAPYHQMACTSRTPKCCREPGQSPPQQFPNTKPRIAAPPGPNRCFSDPELSD